MASKTAAKTKVVKAEKKAEPAEGGARSGPGMWVYALAVIGVLVIAAGVFLILSQPGSSPVPTNQTNTTIYMNTFQYCASEFNKQYALVQLVQNFYNGTGNRVYIVDMPKVLDCNGMNYTYSFELGDGYAKTTLNGYYVRSSFKTGIVTNYITIPEEALEQGVYVYVNRVAPGKLSYSYDLKTLSVARFDAYGVPLAEAYNIETVPTIIWNCKFANVGTRAPSELNGSVTEGSEETVLAKMACIYNNALPEDLCSQLGIVKNPNGTINAQIPTEYLVSMYQASNESCKPDNTTVKADAFYTIECPDCAAQRQVLNSLAQKFGPYMDLTYYCLGPKDQCNKLIKSGA